MFNSLIYALCEFTESVKSAGETDFSHNAELLKQKILLYGRAYSTEDDDHAAVYFYEKEAGALLELLTVYASFKQDDVGDYYADFKEMYSKKRKRQ
jgi:hypothetical protein